MTSILNRRQCLILGSTAAIGRALPWSILNASATFGAGPFEEFHSGIGPNLTHSIIPVVGDGKWIWLEPPKDATGYLEPRLFEVRVGVQASGKLEATEFLAATVAPTSWPEQEILEHRFETDGCEAALQTLSDTASQLVVAAKRIAAGQTISAQAIFKIRALKSYWGYRREQFPTEQRLPRELASEWLGDSPGIETKLASLQKIVAVTTTESTHPWDKAVAFHAWVYENIRGVPGDYTSVRRALESRQGDCEERAGVFVALCRACGIPARLVWVPNHAWAEFMLLDEADQPHWIPAHTAAYSWFGWTGAHEIVLQKGDRIQQNGPDKKVRLILDWWRCGGIKPKITFTASVTPLAENGGDPGPGARLKQADGKWALAGSHADNRHLRS